MVIEQEIWDFFSLFSNNPSEIHEFNSSNKLISISNLFGQKVIDKKNSVLFYNYNNGTVEKKVIID
jgi:hypothetical protein